MHLNGHSEERWEEWDMGSEKALGLYTVYNPDNLGIWIFSRWLTSAGIRELMSLVLIFPRLRMVAKL